MPLGFAAVPIIHDSPKGDPFMKAGQWRRSETQPETMTQNTLAAKHSQKHMFHRYFTATKNTSSIYLSKVHGAFKEGFI
jgi:hypothetical protein